MSKMAKLIIDKDNIELELPVYSATLGPDAVDVSSLVSNGLFTYDPGFMSTAPCKSALTFINGGKGILLHRGYPIDQLAEKSTYMELCYLLLNDDLPTAKQKVDFEKAIKKHISVEKKIENIFKGFDKDAHPMSMLISTVGALAGLYNDELDNANSKNRMETAYKLIAKISTLSAMTYKHSQGEEFLSPRADLSFTENFLYMTFGKKNEEYKLNKVFTNAMDRIFLLHADHEQNASTSTVRLAGSTGANPFACITAGISALWGPLHGGANEAVIKMLLEIGTVDNVDKFVSKAKDKSDPFKLMGFGHRVYKNFDPRAKVMKKTCDEVMAILGDSDNVLLQIAKKLEQIALEDAYFIERKLYPNVDFYSGIILKAIGIPTSMYTVIFSLARTSGWISHWNEMIEMKGKLNRPRQIYIGETSRDIK